MDFMRQLREIEAVLKFLRKIGISPWEHGRRT